MVQHVLSKLLYGLAGYALISVVAIVLWEIWVIRFRRAQVSANNVEAIIRGWLNDSGLSTEPASDPTWKFGLLTTLPDGEAVHIIQLKEHPGFITIQANLAISAEDQAILKALPIGYFEKLSQEIVLGVFLANVALAIRTRLSDVSFYSKLAITADLREVDFRKHLYEVDHAITLARKAISLGVERAPWLVGPRSSRANRLR
jgi:hypothetical protein